MKGSICVDKRVYLITFRKLGHGDLQNVTNVHNGDQILDEL
jgi:hypothetical protein